MHSSPVLQSVDQSVHAALECRRYILPRLGGWLIRAADILYATLYSHSPPSSLYC